MIRSRITASEFRAHLHHLATKAKVAVQGGDERDARNFAHYAYGYISSTLSLENPGPTLAEPTTKMPGVA